jgi:hypothetical protein
MIQTLVALLHTHKPQEVACGPNPFPEPGLGKGSQVTSVIFISLTYLANMT